MSYGETRSSELDTSDPYATGYNSYYEPVTFSGQAGDSVQITMSASANDAYLYLLAPNGSMVAQNDDFGDSTNARIRQTLSESGQYTIIATSYDSQVTFGYTLSLHQIESTGGTGLRAINYGQTRSGELDTFDPIGNGGYYEPVTFSGQAGDVVTINMQSDGGDPYLILRDPNGNYVTEDDDSAGNNNAQIQQTLSMSGEYTIVATSYNSFTTFGYTLSLTKNDLPNMIRIKSTSSQRSYYSFTTSGEVGPGDRANLVDAKVPDSISGNSATGSTATNGTDNYQFSGEVTDFSLDGPANVFVNGKQVDPSTLSSGNGGNNNLQTPDLTLRVRNATTRPGSKITVEFTLANDGAVSASNPGAQVRFEHFPSGWKTVNTSNNEGNWNGHGRWTTTDLRPNDLKSGSFTLAIPSSQDPGNYTFPIQVVDSNGNVVGTTTGAVNVEQSKTPTPTPTPTPTSTPTPTPTPTPTDTQTDTPTDTPTHSQADNNTTTTQTSNATPTDTSTATKTPTNENAGNQTINTSGNATTGGPEKVTSAEDQKTTAASGKSKGVTGVFGPGFRLIAGIVGIFAFVLVAFAAGARMGGREK